MGRLIDKEKESRGKAGLSASLSRASGRWGKAMRSVRNAAADRPLLCAALAFAAVVATAAVLVWFIVFSGMSGPVQFVYDSF